MPPFIFAVATEWLAGAIRSHSSRAGFQIRATTFKIAFCSDDLLLLITNRKESILALMFYIQTFGSLSG